MYDLKMENNETCLGGGERQIDVEFVEEQRLIGLRMIIGEDRICELNYQSEKNIKVLFFFTGQIQKLDWRFL